MDQNNTYGDISPLVGERAARRLLKRGQPRMLTQRFGLSDTHERNTGRVRKWRRYESLPPAVAPLAEGVTPAGFKLVHTDYTAILQEYGAVVYITNRIADTHTDPVLQESVDLLTESYQETIELVTYDTLKAGTNVVYAGQVASRSDVALPPQRGDLRVIVRALHRARAQTISRVIQPSDKVSTAGVKASFFAMCHTDLESDLENVTGYRTAVEYANPGQAMEHEHGSVAGIRFLTTNVGTKAEEGLWPWEQAGADTDSRLSAGAPPAGQEAADVYPILVVAKNAYGCVRLQGKGAVKIKVLNPNQPRGGDPLGQRGTVGFITDYACAILNDLWMVRYEVACTAIPT